jgi:hypothetical protein
MAARRIRLSVLPHRQRACAGRLRPYLVLVATPRAGPWWIAVANMCGSVAVGAAVVASYVVPDSGALRNATDTGDDPGPAASPRQLTPRG